MLGAGWCLVATPDTSSHDHGRLRTWCSFGSALARQAETVLLFRGSSRVWRGAITRLRYIAELLGHERVEQRSEHKGNASKSTTTGEHLEPLAPPWRVRQAPADSALLVYGRVPPAWITLRAYYKHRELS